MPNAPWLKYYAKENITYSKQRGVRLSKDVVIDIVHKFCEDYKLDEIPVEFQTGDNAGSWFRYDPSLLLTIGRERNLLTVLHELGHALDWMDRCARATTAPTKQAKEKIWRMRWHSNRHFGFLGQLFDWHAKTFV
jgi:hypothetical protein